MIRLSFTIQNDNGPKHTVEPTQASFLKQRQVPDFNPTVHLFHWQKISRGETQLLVMFMGSRLQPLRQRVFIQLFKNYPYTYFYHILIVLISSFAKRKKTTKYMLMSNKLWTELYLERRPRKCRASFW